MRSVDEALEQYARLQEGLAQLDRMGAPEDAPERVQIMAMRQTLAWMTEPPETMVTAPADCALGFLPATTTPDDRSLDDDGSESLPEPNP